MNRNNGEPKPNVILRDIYNQLRDEGEVTVAVDDLPYGQFPRVYARLPSSLKLTRHEAWHILLNERKKGKCPAPGKRKKK